MEVENRRDRVGKDGLAVQLEFGYPACMALAPYTPALYLRRNLGRYRSYPHTTVTPIPGAGYDAQNLVWGEQYLNLWGDKPGMASMQYGNYENVPLLGVGADVTPQQVMDVADTLSQIFSNPDATLRAKGPAIVAATDKYLLGPMTDAMASHIAPYLWKYFAPALALLYVGVGISAFYSYSALKAVVGKKSVTANRRRMRRNIGSWSKSRITDLRRSFGPSGKLRGQHVTAVLSCGHSMIVKKGKYKVGDEVMCAREHGSGLRGNRRRSHRKSHR